MPLPSIPDYSTSIKVPQLVHPAVLDNGHPIEKGTNVIKYAGGFCVVFPYETPTKKYAVRCWHAEVGDVKKRTQIIADALKQSRLPYFVGFEYYEDGIVTPLGIQPIVVMDWVNALPLKKYIAKNLDNSNALNKLADDFKAMVTDLHQKHISHGDLQHGNIMVQDDGSLILVDYDSMYVPELQGMKDEIKGLVGYQHESRWKNDFVTEKADYFSELVIYISLKMLAYDNSYWSKLNIENTETMAFTGDDIQSKGTAPIFNELSNISEIQPLIVKLCEFISFNSIDDLVPLEQAVVSKIDSISSKWQSGNGFKASSKKAEIDSSENIVSKWGNGNGYKTTSLSDEADNIATRWRK